MESTLIDENTFRPDRMSTAAEPIFVGASSFLRPDRLGKEEEQSETFQRDPVGNPSHLVELANRQKRVLRRPGRPGRRSVDSEGEGRAIEPRDQASRGAPTV